MPKQTQQRTLDLFREYDETLTVPGNDYRLYQYFVVAYHPTIIKHGDSTREFILTNKLYPLGGEIYWLDALAGCNIQPGYDFSRGYTILACGGGDNGCYKNERVKIDLFSSEMENLGMCQKNCDLVGSEPSNLACSDS